MKNTGLRQVIALICLAPPLRLAYNASTVRHCKAHTHSVSPQRSVWKFIWGLLFMGTRATGKSGSVKSESTPSAIQLRLAFTPS